MITFLAWLSQILLLVLGMFLMIVVLLQRGRGGGLAGAFGGMGGQSAFGTKAGDVFTKITIGIAIVWVIVAGGSGLLLRAAAEQKGAAFGDAPAVTTEDPAVPEGKPAADSVPKPPTPPDGAKSGGQVAPTGGATPAESKAGDATDAAPPGTNAEPASDAPNSN